MKPIVRRSLEVAAGALGLFLAVVWLSGGFGHKIAPGEISPVAAKAPADAVTATVEARTEPLLERASGTIASARRTTISSKILARIVSIEVRAGSVVAKGDVLVRLDDRDLKAQLQASREQLRAAQADLTLRRTELARVKELRTANVASQQQLDQARSAFQVAEANVEAAQEHVKDAEVTLSNAVIHSPVSGRVVDRLAEPGDTAVPGAALLRIYDPGVLRLEVPVRESLAVTLSPGDSLRIEIPALDTAMEGHIDEIVPFAEPGARTLLVKIGLPRDPRLYAGMYGRVEIPAGKLRRLWIPEAAVEHVGQLEFVQVLGSDGRLERRTVTTGETDSQGRLEVLSGLAAGERVLLPAGSAGSAGAAGDGVS